MHKDELIKVISERIAKAMVKRIEKTLPYQPSKELTNGEVIQALFPNCVTNIDSDGWFLTNIDGLSAFTPEWWNAPYQKGGEEE